MAILWEGPFTEMDPLSMRTILDIQLRDLGEMKANIKGKQREDSVLPDVQVALEMYLNDLKNRDATLQDRRMAQSIANAILQDDGLTHEVAKQDQQVISDRELAVQMSKGGSVSIEELGQAPNKDESDP